MNHAKYLFFLLFPILLSSCATYTMTPLEFYNQLHNARPEEVTTEHSMATGSRTYTSNGVKDILCYDKHSKLVTLHNSPQIEMRITDKKGHRHIFYFDTVNLTDSTFSGLTSRILGIRKSIEFSNIRKVEVQNGGKAYHYADN